MLSEHGGWSRIGHSTTRSEFTICIFNGHLQAKLVDFSRVAVSSPVIDVSDFLYSSVHPGLISEHYVTLLQVNFAFHIIRGEFLPLVIIPPFHLKAAHASCSLLGISRF